MTRSTQDLVGTELGGREPVLSSQQQVKTEPGTVTWFQQLLATLGQHVGPVVM